MLRLLQYQDGTLRQGQLTGKKKSYRASTGDDDVVSRQMMIVVQWKAPMTLWNAIPIIWNNVPCVSR